MEAEVGAINNLTADIGISRASPYFSHQTVRVLGTRPAPRRTEGKEFLPQTRWM